MAYAGVAGEIVSGEAGHCFVPDLRWDLVVEQVALEILLVAGAVEDQPVGLRVAEAVGEGDVEPEGNLVDEIVVIGLAAAVVIAAEEQAPLVVEEGPAGEMDGVDTTQPTGFVEVAAGPVDDPEDGDGQPAAEKARFERADGAVLVSNVLVLDRGQQLVARNRGHRGEHGIMGFAPAKEEDEERQGRNEER